MSNIIKSLKEAEAGVGIVTITMNGHDALELMAGELYLLCHCEMSRVDLVAEYFAQHIREGTPIEVAVDQFIEFLNKKNVKAPKYLRPLMLATMPALAESIKAHAKAQLDEDSSKN